MFASKTEDEKEHDQHEIDEYVEMKEKEFEHFTKEDEAMAEREAFLKLDEIPSTFPDEYAQFKVSLNFKEIDLRLFGYEGNEKQKVCTIKTGGLSAEAEIGAITQNIKVSLGSLEILDEIHPYSRYNYLTHTVMEKGYSKNEFIHFEANINSKRKKGSARINFETRARQYIVANFILIDALQKFFTAESVDVSYYGKVIQDKVNQYIQLGTEYIETTDIQTDYKGVDIKMKLQTPILVIPENIRGDDEDKEAVILNLGMFKGNSNCQEFDKYTDYTRVNNSELLYDKYKLEFQGFRLTMVKDLEHYENWERCEEKIDIIHNVTFTFKAKRCVCPTHPDFAKFILKCKIHNIHINFSDYIMVNLFQTIDSLQMSLDPYLTLEEKLGERISMSKMFSKSSSEMKIQESSEEEGESEEGESQEEESEEDMAENSESEQPTSRPSKSQSMMESRERLVSQYDEESSEELTVNEGGEDSKYSELESPQESSEQESENEGESSQQESEEINESSYLTAGDVHVEDKNNLNSSTTYRSWTETGNESSQADVNSIQSNEERNISQPIIPSKKRGSMDKELLKKESVFASKVKDPKTFITNVSQCLRP